MSKEKCRLFYYGLLLALLAILVIYGMLYQREENAERDEIANIVAKINLDTDCYVDNLTNSDKIFLES